MYVDNDNSDLLAIFSHTLPNAFYACLSKNNDYAVFLVIFVKVFSKKINFNPNISVCTHLGLNDEKSN